MPYVNIKVTQEGGPNGTGPSPEQKAQLIKGVTDLLQDILGKSPSSTFITIDEVEMANWGIGGLPVPDYRKSLSGN
ncbi:tautomerase family protein [Sneathiella limimaris]|uniref:tautomerase family protein n=1 Tax=Sneathiella limimaris TaxID=1964213 RepID=UPI00146C38A5|nr:4-oxalocrotonate tautomerase family protein [Sneathiella limimaris]